MGQQQIVVTRFTIGNVFFSVSALGKSAVVWVKNAILPEQCEILWHVGNKM